jgi:hypothetical protein
MPACRTPLQVFLTERHLVLVMEYASGGNLFQYVSQRGGLSEQDARWFFQQLIIALAYCHSMVGALWVDCLHSAVLCLPMAACCKALPQCRLLRVQTSPDSRWCSPLWC